MPQHLRNKEGAQGPESPTQRSLRHGGHWMSKATEHPTGHPPLSTEEGLGEQLRRSLRGSCLHLLRPRAGASFPATHINHPRLLPGTQTILPKVSPLMAMLSSDGFRPGKRLSHQATFRDLGPLKQGTGTAGFANLAPGTSGAHPPGARSTLPSCDNHKCPQGGRVGQTRSPGMVSVWILTSQIFVGFLNWEDHYR